MQRLVKVQLAFILPHHFSSLSILTLVGIQRPNLQIVILSSFSSSAIANVLGTKYKHSNTEANPEAKNSQKIIYSE